MKRERKPKVSMKACISSGQHPNERDRKQNEEKLLLSESGQSHSSSWWDCRKYAGAGILGRKSVMSH